jgi:hypothetical protein
VAVRGVPGQRRRRGVARRLVVHFRVVGHLSNVTSVIGRVTRGRCYDNNFPRTLQISSKKIGVFLKNQCFDQILALVSFLWSKKRQFFSRKFLAKIF